MCMVFGFGLGFDAIKAATGQQLKGTMTVTGVVQEDGLTLSVTIRIKESTLSIH